VRDGALLLRRNSTLPSANYRHDRILVGPGENAGVADLGRYTTSISKIESQPPLQLFRTIQGAATGVGDIFR